MLLRHEARPLEAQGNGSEVGKEPGRGIGVGWCTFAMVG